MGQHLAGMLNQEAQQLIFLRRELHLLAAALDDPAHEIDRQVAKLEDRPLALHLELMPERRADACQQLLHAEGLGHVVVGAQIERLDLGNFVAAAREHDDGQVLSLLREFGASSSSPCMSGRPRSRITRSGFSGMSSRAVLAFGASMI